MDKKKKNTDLFSKLSSFSDKTSVPSFDDVLKTSEEGFRGHYSHKFSETVVEAPSYLWNPIAKELAGRKKRRVIAYWSAAGIALIVASTLFVFNSQQEQFAEAKAGSSVDVSNEASGLASVVSQKVTFQKHSWTQVLNNMKEANTASSSVETVVNDPEKKKQQKALGNSSFVSKKEDHSIVQSEEIKLGIFKGAPFPVLSLGVDSTDLEIVLWSIFEEDRLPKKEENTPILLANLAGGGLSSSSAVNSIPSSFSADNTGLATSMEASVPVYDSLVKRAPITFGLEIRMPIGKRFYWNQGLQFSFQKNEYYSNGSLQLEKNKYVGIPLELLFVIKSWRKLSLFAHAGHIQEVLIHSSKEYETGGTVSFKPYSLQLGASAGFSANYLLYKGLGVSTFVGASNYYFMPENSYFAEKNILPSLRISIGYTF